MGKVLLLPVSQDHAELMGRPQMDAELQDPVPQILAQLKMLSPATECIAVPQIHVAQFRRRLQTIKVLIKGGTKGGPTMMVGGPRCRTVVRMRARVRSTALT
jgi:hypothetical protein